jgi:hypothetical protein
MASGQKTEVATAHVAHGTTRAVLVRAQPAVADRATTRLSCATNDRDREQQPSSQRIVRSRGRTDSSRPGDRPRGVAKTSSRTMRPSSRLVVPSRAEGTLRRMATWPRDRYSGSGGGLSTGPGGGGSTGPGGGASTGPGGGLSTGPGGGLSTGPGGGLSTGPGGGLSTGPGGGLSTGPGGGLSTGPGGGMSTGPGGGLYAGACANPYRSNIPPIPDFVNELRRRGLHSVADRLAAAHGLTA